MAAKNAPKLWDTVNGLTDREWSVFMQLLRSRLDQNVNDHVLVSSLASKSVSRDRLRRHLLTLNNLTVMRLVRKGLVRSCAMSCDGITGVYARVTTRGVDAYLMLLGDIEVTA